MTRIPSNASFHLADFFDRAALVNDGVFGGLDEADAMMPGALVYCQTFQYFQLAAQNANVAAIVTTPKLADRNVGKGLVASDDPRRAFFEVYVTLTRAGFLGATVPGMVGKDCNIHPSAVIGIGARIHDNVEIDANAVISDNVIVGRGCYIGPNAVVGAEGLLTLRDTDGNLLRVKHAGGVDIGPNVEVLAGAVIAKSLFRAYTRIGSDSQIGIMANIGHGACIGERCVISGNSVVAGRVSIADDVWVGVSSSIAQGLTIGKGARIKMGSVVASDVRPNKVVSGNFAVDHKMAMREYFRIAGARR